MTKIMTILYVPFKEETDLLNNAQFWKNACGKAENVTIFQHGHEMPDIDESAYMKVYVLGHGIDPKYRYGDRHIASHADSRANYTVLPIDEIASRFEADFMYYRPNIAVIKLYFCNTFGTQKQIAESFQQNLTAFGQDREINYYCGTLSAPSPQKYAFFGNGIFVRASQARAGLFSKNDAYLHETKGIKGLTLLENQDKAKQYRKKQYKKFSFTERENHINSFRKLKP